MTDPRLPCSDCGQRPKNYPAAAVVGFLGGIAAWAAWRLAGRGA